MEALTIEGIKLAYEIVKSNKFYSRTELVQVDPLTFGIKENIKLYIKNEGNQVSGSFKIRGVINQFHNAPDNVKSGDKKLITMSAGNYGKAFATTCQDQSLKGLVVMPDSVPPERQDVLKDLGVSVELVPKEELIPTVDNYVKSEEMIFMHPFDDIHLLAGYGSIGLEIVEDLPNVDIIIVSCGGGGLLSGVAAAVKLNGQRRCRIYGVEPLHANTMWRSFQGRRVVSLPQAKSIAAGLAPPYAGQITFRECYKYAKELLLVTDEEICAATVLLNKAGIKAETSGAASLAGLKKFVDLLIAGSYPPLSICLLISGSNISEQDLEKLYNSSE